MASVAEGKPISDSSISTHVYRIRPLASPMFDARNGKVCEQLDLIPGKLYTIGRSKSSCDLIFHDRRVSRQHCQIFLDPKDYVLYLFDGCAAYFRKDLLTTALNNLYENKLVGEVDSEGAGLLSSFSFQRGLCNGVANEKNRPFSKANGATKLIKPYICLIDIGITEFGHCNGRSAVLKESTDNHVMEGLTSSSLQLAKRSLNGIYVDGQRLGAESFQILTDSSEISLVESAQGLKSLNRCFGMPVGFIVEKFTATGKFVCSHCTDETSSDKVLTPGRLQGKRKLSSALSGHVSSRMKVARSLLPDMSDAANAERDGNENKRHVCHLFIGNRSSFNLQSDKNHEECSHGECSLEPLCTFSPSKECLLVGDSEQVLKERSKLDDVGRKLGNRFEDSESHKTFSLAHKFNSFRSRGKSSSLVISAEKLIEASQSLRNSILTSLNVDTCTLSEASKAIKVPEISRDRINKIVNLHDKSVMTTLSCKYLPAKHSGGSEMLKRIELGRPCRYMKKTYSRFLAKKISAPEQTSFANNLKFTMESDDCLLNLPDSVCTRACLEEYKIGQLMNVIPCQMILPTVPYDTSQFPGGPLGGLLDPANCGKCHPDAIEARAPVHLTSPLKPLKNVHPSAEENVEHRALVSIEGEMESLKSGETKVSPETVSDVPMITKNVGDSETIGSGCHSNSNSVDKTSELKKQEQRNHCCSDLGTSEFCRVDLFSSYDIPAKFPKSFDTSSPCPPVALEETRLRSSDPSPDTSFEKHGPQSLCSSPVLGNLDHLSARKSLGCISNPGVTMQISKEELGLDGAVQFAEKVCIADEYGRKLGSRMKGQDEAHHLLTPCFDRVQIGSSKNEALDKSSSENPFVRGTCSEIQSKSRLEEPANSTDPSVSILLPKATMQSQNCGAESSIITNYSTLVEGTSLSLVNGNTEDCPASNIGDEKRCRRPSLPNEVVEAEGDAMRSEGVVFNQTVVSNDIMYDEKLKPHGNICSAKYGPNSHGFCLNKLEWMDQSGSSCSTVTLKELLEPIHDVQAIFIATFTSDILWFMHSNNISPDLPVTVCCHDSERCWSSSKSNRSSVPFSRWPNLRIIYPSFPDVCTFKGEQNRRGIGCHHPKLFLLKRRNSLRVIISSANLNARQWLHVSNTVWWQDFDRVKIPNFQALFQFSEGQMKDPAYHNVAGDFAAQLASFVASLLTEIPEEAKWVVDLAFYDFSKASALLVASIPGLHVRHSQYFSNEVTAADFFPRRNASNYLGFFGTTVVGINHRFHPQVDPNGARLRALAQICSKGTIDTEGMTQVVLKRERSVPVDPNAVSVLVPLDIESSQDLTLLERGSNWQERSQLFSSQETFVHLGFLPKATAQWVAILCDSGVCSFKATLSLREAFLVASSQSNSSVCLMLHVFQGPEFCYLSETSLTIDIVAALSCLLGSLHHCVGVWRLKEILSHYDWTDSEETDFIYGSSSMGISLDAPFFAYFSAAVGRRATSSSQTNESDPEWGCWTAAHEVENPSIDLVFPTIERAKAGRGGLSSHIGLLSFAESTWQRLKEAHLLHDAVPYPPEREGAALHTKIARRRFRHSSGVAYGWVYCGSHNFSPAAWGKCVGTSSHHDACRSAATDVSLHIYNYELGLVFIEPPPVSKIVDATPSDSRSSLHKILISDATETGCTNEGLDRFVLPFVVPPPVYQPSDRPATGKALYEARCDLELKLYPEIASKNTKVDEADRDLLEAEAPIDGDLVPEQQLPLLEAPVPSEKDENYAEALFIHIGSFDSL